MRLTIRSNIDEIARELDDVHRSQLPFARSLALTRTAQDAQAKLRSSLRTHFTIRNAWVRGSIKIDKANKKNQTPTATVGSVYGPMALHVEGGEKTSPHAVVPIAARPRPKAKTEPDTFPSRLLAQPNFFLEDGKIWERIREGQRKLWWDLRERVEIKPGWPFEEEVNTVVERELFDHFWAAMEYAWQTRRR